MNLHVFVDESRRNSTYLVAAALIQENHQLRHVRALMRRLRMPGARRIHFKHERDSVQKDIAAAVVDAQLRARIYVGRGKAETVRRKALRAMVLELEPLHLRRLVFDSRGHALDRSDRQVISSCLPYSADLTPFSYEHMRSHEEPALWVPDVVAWCWGAGGEWRRRIEPIVENVCEVTTSSPG
ncbi:hypothetical protein [Actinokineospora sp.]|uniref:hypothetical protein n=1 Tax=Actinokineospora sp. TaxID=1872133 RepID=UPI004038046C